VTLEPDLGNASVGSISAVARADRSAGHRGRVLAGIWQGLFVLPPYRKQAS